MLTGGNEHWARWLCFFRDNKGVASRHQQIAHTNGRTFQAQSNQASKSSRVCDEQEETETDEGYTIVAVESKMEGCRCGNQRWKLVTWYGMQWQTLRRTTHSSQPYLKCW
jgi:hypothetical protein